MSNCYKNGYMLTLSFILVSLQSHTQQCEDKHQPLNHILSGWKKKNQKA